MTRPTKRDLEEFKAYLSQMTIAQLGHIYAKEKAAGRNAYAQLAMNEANARGFAL